MPTDTATAKRTSPTYLEAVSAALDSEMDRDPDVFIIGEDVGQFGGAFKVTKGFLDKFGPRRVVDTPIAETGFTGLAAGAALVGLRPVVEFQFADFISCAFDPIINVGGIQLAGPVQVSGSHRSSVDQRSPLSACLGPAAIRQRADLRPRVSPVS
jgi:deoxyxylulose-5-phosphate synthase